MNTKALDTKKIKLIILEINHEKKIAAQLLESELEIEKNNQSLNRKIKLIKCRLLNISFSFTHLFDE